MSATTKKFLALAISAYRSKQFEEAGVLFAQAASSDEAEKIATELAGNVDVDVPTPDALQPHASVQKVDEPVVTENAESDEAGTTDNAEEGTKLTTDTVGDAFEIESSSSEFGADALESSEGELGDTDADPESVSSIVRRKTTSLHQIGKVIAASLQAISSEGSDDHDLDDGLDDTDEDDTDAEELDPDMPGEVLLPASFSSIRIKKDATAATADDEDNQSSLSNEITSPIRLKN